MYDIIEQFKVRAEDGTVYDAMVKQDIVGVTATDDKRIESIPGLKEIVLADGRHMNKIDDDTFLIVTSGERVTRV